MIASRYVGRPTLLSLVCAAALIGCSPNPAAEPVDPSAAQTSAVETSAEPSGTYDISRLAEVQADIPTDFIPKLYPRERLKEQFSAAVGNVIEGGDSVTVEPAECGPALRLVDAAPGVEAVMVRADPARREQDKQGISLGAYSPVTGRSNVPSTECAQVSYRATSEHFEISGTVDQMTAPKVDGATTFAFKDTADGFPTIDYYYAAILGDDVFVRIQARLDPGVDAQPLLTDLLTKSIAAIRG